MKYDNYPSAFISDDLSVLEFISKGKWDTFSTGGRCPSCHKVWEDTKCPGQPGGCSKWSPHLDWYENLDKVVSEIRQEIEIAEKTLFLMKT